MIDFRELVMGIGLGILIRMPMFGKFFVSFANILIGGCTRNTENFIGIEIILFARETIEIEKKVNKKVFD